MSTTKLSAEVLGQLMVKAEQPSKVNTDLAISDATALVRAPTIEEATLAVDGGAISENAAEAYRQGFIAGAQVRKATPGAANALCWSCGQDPHQPSHAEQVEMLRDAMWSRQLPIFMWPQEEF